MYSLPTLSLLSTPSIGSSPRGREAVPPTAQPPEPAVLLACARAYPSAEDDRRLATLLAAGVDFGTLLALAERHRLTPLVYSHLSRVAPVHVPRSITQALRHSYQASAAHGLTLAAEVAALVRLFAAHHIRALPFNGPILARCVYGNLALGHLTDIDILVPPQDARRARALLLARGYRAETTLLPGSVAWRLEHQLRVARPADGAVVELQWTVASRTLAREVGIEQLWGRRLQTSLLGTSVSSPSHEHLLLVLCIQGARRAWRRLELICAVADLVRSKPLDWYRVLDEADAWRCARMLRVGMLLAHQLLDAPIPKFVLAMAQSDADACTLAELASVELFADPTAAGRNEPRRFQLGIQDDVAEKLRVLWYWPITGLARQATKLAVLV